MARALRMSLVQLPAQHSYLQGQRKSSGALSNRISKISKDGGCTTSTGSLFQSLIILVTKRVYLLPKLSLFWVNLYQLSHAPTTVKGVIPLSRQSSHTYRVAAIRTLRAFSSLNTPVPSAFLQGQVLQTSDYTGGSTMRSLHLYQVQKTQDNDLQQINKH